MPDINIKNEENWGALHFACYSGNFGMLKFLIQKDADIEIENNMRQTPLVLASKMSHHYIVEYLIKIEAHINSQDFYKNTALHYACNNGNFY